MRDEASYELVNRSIEAISRIGTLQSDLNHLREEIADTKHTIRALEASNKDMAELVAAMLEIIEAR